MKLKVISVIIGSILVTGVVSLAYFGLFVDISDEIELREVMDVRKSENIQNLKDLRQVQLQYKKDKGYYANNGDTLLYYLLNEKVKFINTDKADQDSIPDNMRKWKNIRNRFIRSIRQKINPSAVAKKIYKEAGGKWKTLTKQEKIDKGYIDVDTFMVHQLAFNSEYMQTRRGIYNIDFDNLSQISNIYKKQASYTSFKSDFKTYQKSTLENIKLQSIYSDIIPHYTYLFDGNPATKISIKEIETIIELNKQVITSLQTKIEEKKLDQQEAEENIKFVIDKRNAYTKEIGEETILKVKEKAKKKEEKGKKLKGRKGVVFDIISNQDSTEEANKLIVNECKSDIIQLEDEMNARKELTKIIERNIQCLLDLEAMQKQFSEINIIECANFTTLASYILNETIEIVTILKKGKYTIPTLPEEWKKAEMQAELLVEQSLGDDMIKKIDESYQKSGGKWRKLTEEEGYARGLITIIIKPVEEVIFNHIYLKERKRPKLETLIYIPYTNIKYNFAAIKKEATLQEKSQGEIDKYFFEISASYDDIFNGLDKENIMLRTHRERTNIKVGSLEKTITNGNWGE